MKVIYFSQPFFADCDFPLVKELQRKGVDIRLYMPLRRNFQRSSILEFHEPMNRWGIIKAANVKGLEIYKDCLDLDRFYFICGTTSWKNPSSWLLWIMVYCHFLFQRAQVLHITWQLSGFEKFLFYIPFVKRIMTVHDPFQHSGTDDEEKKEKYRRACFKWADAFVLLNKLQVQEFSIKYSIPIEKIFVTKLGAYDSIYFMNLSEETLPKSRPYILFFGLISPYKGIEYLLDAMVKMHSSCPEVDLVIAGSGELYFDAKKYEELDYIKIINRFIGIKELVPLVKNCLFTVCPYIDATQSGVIQTSFALNVPVVATNVGALPDMVIDNLYGKIIPPCDSQLLSAVLTDLIRHPEKLAEIKTNIVERWRPSMSWAPIADDYINIYCIC